MAENAPLKILCIDDSIDQFVLIEGYLEVIRSPRTAYDVEWAPTYNSAMKMLANTRYDVCLVDLQLGDRNGLDLIREVRQTTLDMPMILMTGHGGLDIDVEAMQLGAADYIDKAELTVPALERSLRYAIEHTRARAALRQAEQAIRESEKRFRALVEKGSDFVLLVDEGGVIRYASPSFEHKLGYQGPFLAGVQVQTLILDEDIHIIEAALAALIESPEAATSDLLRILHHDGSWRWVEVAGTNMLNEAGVEGLVLNAHDVTAHKKAREAEYKQRVLAEALLDTAVVLSSIQDFDTVLEHILAIVERVVPHDTASILMLEGDEMHTVGVYGYDDPQIEAAIRQARLSVHEIPLFQQMLKTREVLIISSVENDSLITQKLQSYIGVPVISGDAIIAFLNLGSFRAGFFREEHIRPLQAFAHQAALAIQNARAFERAKEFAAVEERQRLARDLHDAVSQTLFSASVIAEALPRLWASNHGDAQRDTLTLARLTKGALAEMRTLLLELRPAALIDTDFSVLLKHLVAAAASRSETEFAFEPSGPELKLPPDVQVGLYRIVQEAFNNIIKHAHAARVQIDLEQQPDRVAVTVQDDGRGFDVHDTPTAAGMGLRIMNERASSIHASVKIESQVGSGTTIFIQWARNGKS